MYLFTHIQTYINIFKCYNLVLCIIDKYLLEYLHAYMLLWALCHGLMWMFSPSCPYTILFTNNYMNIILCLLLGLSSHLLLACPLYHIYGSTPCSHSGQLLFSTFEERLVTLCSYVYSSIYLSTRSIKV